LRRPRLDHVRPPARLARRRKLSEEKMISDRIAGRELF
jgi:hypothetical protein